MVMCPIIWFKFRTSKRERGIYEKLVVSISWLLITPYLANRTLVLIKSRVMIGKHS